MLYLTSPGRWKLTDRNSVRPCHRRRNCVFLTSTHFYCIHFTAHMDIFDELYPGVKKFKVLDGNFFEMGTSREAFGAP